MSFLGKCISVFSTHIKSTLVSGLLLIIPLVITFVILRFVFGFFEDILKEPLDRVVPGGYKLGMGIASLVVIIYLIGLATSHVSGRRMVTLGMGLIDMVPVVRSVYRTVHQATQVFSAVGSDGKLSSVVLVDFPGPELRSIGLVTSTLKDQDGKTLLVVYMPTSPFPTSGFLVILPEDRVTPTDIPVDDAMKLIVSAGIMAPESITSYPNPVAKTPMAGSVISPPPEGQSVVGDPSETENSNQ